MALLFDLEGDGLLDTITKIHCVSYKDPVDRKIKTVYDYDEMRGLFQSHTIFIGHNIVMYDIPAVEKILGIKVKGQFIDTLALSWYLHHDRVRHGLESYGEDYGRPKPVIDDWENLTPEEYGHRCSEDVWINDRLWQDLRRKLLLLYDTKEEADRLIDYLAFKMDCLREQERSRWKLDVEKAQRHHDELVKAQEDKLEELKHIMPPRKLTAKRTRPAKPFKKDGTYSTHGAKWFALLKEYDLPKDYDGEVEVELGEELANPNSPEQVKSWLYSLGWEPETFKFDKDADGNERQIPQVRKEVDGEKVLCDSVLRLAEVEPSVKVLEGLSVIQHRLGIFKGFLNNHEDGWLIAQAHGLTNTLRFRHKNPLVNLPKVDKPWGEEIRGSLIAPEGYVLCGSDMVSLEDTTKRHYMWDYDPEYVTEMAKPGFDPHLDLAKYAGAVTQEEIDAYVNKDPGAKNLKPLRTNYKSANYACIYGVGGPKLARTTGLSVAEARKLIDAYWARNWSVKAVVESLTIKKINGEMWLFNPVSRFYYSLRYEKDAFSTLNQGTGVYCFDSWIMEWRTKRSQLTGQFHDEIITCIPVGKEEAFTKILKDAIARVNEKLKLNIKLDIDVKFGKTYAEVH